MNANQENRVSMFFKVRLFLNDNVAVLAADIPSLTNEAAEFNTLLDELGNSEIKAMEIRGGYAKQKKIYRLKMSADAVVVAGGLRAYAIVTKDHALEEKLQLNKTILRKQRDTDVLFTCESLYEIAQLQAANISSYGVSTTMLASFQNSIHQYRNFIKEPVNKRGESKTAGREVDEIIEAMMTKLKVIDGMMDTQIEQQRLLYLHYYNNRGIDDYKGGRRKAPDVVETIAPGSVVSVYTAPYLPTRSFKVKNKGRSEILWGLSNDKGMITNPVQTIGAGSKSRKKSSTLGKGGDYLVFQNTSTEAVTVEVSVN